MTKAKTDSRKLNAEQTFLNLANRLKSEPESTEKREGLTTAIKHVLQVLLIANWRQAAVYRHATAFVTAENDAMRLRASDELATILDAGIPELAEQPDLHTMAAGLTQILHAAGFTGKEIAELVDDARGGSPEQKHERARSRFSGLATESVARFWNTALVNGK